MEFDAILLPPRREEMIAKGYWRDQTMADYFARCMANIPDKIGLIAHSAETGEVRQFTYREMDLMAERVARGLVRLGISKSDVISCQLPNWWQVTMLYLGAMRIGAVFNPMMPIFREAQLGFMLKHAQTRLLVAPARFRNFDHVAMIDGLRLQLPDLEHVLYVGGENQFETLLLDPALDNDAEAAAEVAARHQHPDDIFQLIYTSGTTGEPKAVMHSSNTLFSAIELFCQRVGLSGDDIVFMASPLAHQTGFVYGMMLPIWLQGSSVLLDVWEPENAADVILETASTFTMASTPFLSDLTEVARHSPEKFATLGKFLCAGAPIPEAIVERAQQQMKTAVFSAWGMSETGAITVTRDGDPGERAVMTDGVPLPGTYSRIIDDNGQICPPGVPGRFFVQTASCFGGYLKRPHLNSVDEDGWFDTGDIARADADGYIRICGRTKDVIIRGAENIPVVEVEALLYSHPAIDKVALIGYPDDRLGERVCAVVSLKDGAVFDLEEMVAFLIGKRLTKQYIPEKLMILDALPMTTSGKIQKFELRDVVLRAC